jgi:hypothetical protein
MSECPDDYQGGDMHPEDLFDPGTYIDTVTGDVWQKDAYGGWTVNGVRHKPFPHSLVVETDEALGHTANPKDRTLRDTEGYTE